MDSPSSEYIRAKACDDAGLRNRPGQPPCLPALQIVQLGGSLPHTTFLDRKTEGGSCHTWHISTKEAKKLGWTMIPQGDTCWQKYCVWAFPFWENSWGTWLWVSPRVLSKADEAAEKWASHSDPSIKQWNTRTTGTFTCETLENTELYVVLARGMAGHTEGHWALWKIHSQCKSPK